MITIHNFIVVFLFVNSQNWIYVNKVDTFFESYFETMKRKARGFVLKKMCTDRLYVSTILVFCLLRSQIPDCSMDSFTIVPAFNILKKRKACFLKRIIDPLVDLFFFQDCMKRFNTRIVIRGSFTTIRMHDFTFLKRCFKFFARVLRAKICLDNQVFFRLLVLNC